MVISVNRRLFRYFGSYSGISVIPVILVNRRTRTAVARKTGTPDGATVGMCVYYVKKERETFSLIKREKKEERR